MLELVCAHCGLPLRVSPSLNGKTGQCPSCHGYMAIRIEDATTKPVAFEEPKPIGEVRLTRAPMQEASGGSVVFTAVLSGALLVGSGLGALAGFMAQQEDEPPRPEPATNPKLAPRAEPWLDASRPAQVGPLQVQIVSVRVDKVKMLRPGLRFTGNQVREYFVPEASAEDYLQIAVEIYNGNETALHYQGWNENASLKDNRERSFKPCKPPMPDRRIPGFVQGDLPIDGKKTVRDLLLFPVPEAPVDFLLLDLPPANIGSFQPLQFRITKGTLSKPARG